ncbi:hypothetical protein LP415_19055 [Polaromonas sp. P1(28)-8]|nr:hypothetical protein LP415_19055 [Polaromonas sp. P1(28)-8]
MPPFNGSQDARMRAKTATFGATLSHDSVRPDLQARLPELLACKVARALDIDGCSLKVGPTPYNLCTLLPCNQRIKLFSAESISAIPRSANDDDAELNASDRLSK